MIVDMLNSKNKGSIYTNPNTDEKLHSEGNGFKVFIDNLRSKPSEITTGNAYTFEDVYACINVLSDDIAKLPLKTYKKTNDEVKKLGTNNAVAKVLSKRPNPYMTPSVFKKLMMVDVLTAGDFYAKIVFGKSGAVESLIPLDANVTTPVMNKNKDLWYQTTIDSEIILLPDYCVVHIKGYSNDGLTGRSPISVIADSAEGNKHASEFNKRSMLSGGTPKGILSVPGSLNNEAKERAKKSWSEVNSGEEIAVIDSGMDYKQVSMSQRDIEFVESQKYNQQKIAAIYKVPLHKINNLDHATFSNIEHQSLDYVKNTLQPWIVQIEEELNTKLFSKAKQGEGYYVKFNLDSELRGDAESRAKVQEINVRNGFDTVIDVRL
ncbi:MAG: phage portal protein, partial [Pisciglobus halotolerans]|nr:phage portal protein [Pisciglobus halotolerans]